MRQLGAIDDERSDANGHSYMKHDSSSAILCANVIHKIIIITSQYIVNLRFEGSNRSWGAGMPEKDITRCKPIHHCAFLSYMVMMA